MKKKTRQLLILNGLLILIVAAAILSVNSGYARIPFRLRFAAYSNLIWREPP